jgi:glucose-6-phosphate 1-dehydrogenase|tara:strand:+ start:926 stop:2389 length:1464 start_codon:yes stop_codon:yes gene_type:complete
VLNDTAVLPFDLVIFGATGDLALRKLIPALYHRYVDGQIPEGRIIAAARRPKTDEEFVADAEDWAKRFISEAEFDQSTWDKFAEKIVYARVDATNEESFGNLAKVLADYPERERVFYLSTAPDFFGTISEYLHNSGVITDKSRVVLEKPLGHDLASANEINEKVGQFFDEQAIYRIDHYLGKETVQNLIVMRFGNSIIESLWNNNFVDHIQITVSEEVGVEKRAGFYDNAGALRDMVQNHLLQLLCMVAMEAPPSLDSNEVRDEKLKVLRSLRPIGNDLKSKVIRGQYSAGAIKNEAVPGYLEEEGVPQGSRTETFVAIKAEVDNWRWAGVPFYLRTGKRMAKRQCEIVVQFKAVPHSIFETEEDQLPANKLIIRLQPDEGIKLELFGKKVGPGMRLRPLELNLSTEEDRARVPDAYERLLVDAIAGRSTLFNRRDELDAAWRWVEPILNGWADSTDKPEAYSAGTWGPSAATALLARDGRLWHEDA